MVQANKTSLGKVYKPKIKIIGVGGGGSAIVNEIAQMIEKEKVFSPQRTEFIAANVDLQALKLLKGRVKSFYFGEKVTSGLGCGMKPEIGNQAAQQYKEHIKRELKNCDFCIFISCLGGGTGSGATPVFAEIAEDLKKTSFGIFTTPFKFEGLKREQIAKETIQNLTPKLNAITIIPNQKIFQVITNKTSLNDAFSSINKFLAKTIIGFLEMLYLPGVINIDFADFQTVFKQKGQIAYFSWGQGEGINRTDKALEAIMKNPLLNYNHLKLEKMLFNIAGSRDLKVKEVEKISRAIFNLNPAAKIIMGISQNNKYHDKIKITLLTIGNQIKKKEATQEKKPAKQTQKQEKAKEHKKQTLKPKEGKTSSKKETPPQEKAQDKKNETKISQKEITRRDALDLHKKMIEEETKMLEEEQKWDIPTFLRKKYTH